MTKPDTVEDFVVKAFAAVLHAAVSGLAALVMLVPLLLLILVLAIVCAPYHGNRRSP